MRIQIHLVHLHYRIVHLCMLIGIGTMVPVLAQGAGHAVEFELQSQGRNINQTALIQQGRILVAKVAGDVGKDMVFDARNSTLHVIDHRQKSYLTVDQPLIDKVASIVESLSAGEEQSGLADLLKSMGLTNEAEPPVTIKARNDSLTTAGITCRVFQFYQKTTLKSEACLAANSDIPLGENLATLRAFYQFGEQIRKRAGKILSFLGVTVPVLQIDTSDSLPIMIYSTEDGSKTLLRSISERNTTIDRFSIPAGYQKSRLPFLG